MSKSNGVAEMQVVDPIVRRVLTEIAALLQCDQSLKIVINKAGRGVLAVKGATLRIVIVTRCQ